MDGFADLIKIYQGSEHQVWSTDRGGQKVDLLQCGNNQLLYKCCNSVRRNEVLKLSVGAAVSSNSEMVSNGWHHQMENSN